MGKNSMTNTNNIHATEDRVMHFCSLFEVDIPKLDFDERHGVLLDDNLMAWVEKHDCNMDWLFTGSPDGLLKSWAKRKSGLGYIVEQVCKMNREQLVRLLEKIKEMNREASN